MQNLCFGVDYLSGMVGEKDKRYNSEERKYSAISSVIKIVLSHRNVKTRNCLRS